MSLPGPSAAATPTAMGSHADANQRHLATANMVGHRSRLPDAAPLDAEATCARPGGLT
jgi:hypothetical protein